MGGGGVSTRVLPRGSVGPVCASPSPVASSHPPSCRRAPASTAPFHHCGHARAHRNATSQRRRSSLRLCDPDPAPPLQPPPRRRLVPCPLRLRGCRRRRGRPVSMPVLRGRPAPPPSYLRRRGRRVASARAQPRQLTARTPSTTPCLQVCVCMQTARRALRRRLSPVVVRRCDAVCLRCAAHAARLAVAALLLLACVTTLPPPASLPVTRCQRLIIISSLHGRSSMMCRAIAGASPVGAAAVAASGVAGVPCAAADVACTAVPLSCPTRCAGREVSITPNAAYEGTAYGEAVLRMERVTEGAAEGAVGPGAH